MQSIRHYQGFETVGNTWSNYISIAFRNGYLSGNTDANKPQNRQPHRNIPGRISTRKATLFALAIIVFAYTVITSGFHVPVVQSIASVVLSVVAATIFLLLVVYFTYGYAAYVSFKRDSVKTPLP